MFIFERCAAFPEPNYPDFKYWYNLLKFFLLIKTPVLNSHRLHIQHFQNRRFRRIDASNYMQRACMCAGTVRAPIRRHGLRCGLPYGLRLQRRGGQLKNEKKKIKLASKNFKFPSISKQREHRN